MRSSVPCRVLLASLLLSISTSAHAGRLDGSPAEVEAVISGDAEAVFAAVKDALAEWRFRKASLKDGIVKTDWRTRKSGRQTFRGRFLVEFSPDGYFTRVRVKHERQRKRQELQTSIGGPSGGWSNSDGDPAAASAVIRAVEAAFGQGPPKAVFGDQPLAARPSAPPKVEYERVVPPEIAARINRLKVERKEHAREIRDLDARLLAVSSGLTQESEEDLKALQSRRRALEKRITSIDRDILAMVLAH
ncbi:MAG: hypothetical protein AAF533_27215 [Acidobacteriota bacterium]